MTRDEQQALWEATNKEHGATCRECNIAIFEGDYFVGCQLNPTLTMPQDCPAVRRAMKGQKEIKLKKSWDPTKAGKPLPGRLLQTDVGNRHRNVGDPKEE